MIIDLFHTRVKGCWCRGLSAAAERVSQWLTVRTQATNTIPTVSKTPTRCVFQSLNFNCVAAMVVDCGFVVVVVIVGWKFESEKRDIQRHELTNSQQELYILGRFNKSNCTMKKKLQIYNKHIQNNLF